MNDNQKRFAQEYIVDCNAAAAAVRAGYSERTANVKGSQLYNTPEIHQYIKTLQRDLELKTGVTSEMVVDELAKVGFVNIADFLTPSNEIADLTDLPKEKTAAVSGIKVIVDVAGNVTTELKFHNKVIALEKLGQHLGIFEKDNKQKAPIVNINNLDAADLKQLLALKKKLSA